MIKLGQRVRDKITGFEGVVVCRTEWLNGCTRLGVQATTLKDGKPLEAEHFDEEQVEVVEDTPEPTRKPTGGPRPAAMRQPDPTR